MPTMLTVVGNVTRKPERKEFENGRSRASFSVAVNRRWRSRGDLNNWQEQVAFHNVVVWDSLADNCTTSLDKGSRVVVTGRLDQRIWLDDKGIRHTTYEIVADEVGAALRYAKAELSRNERRFEPPAVNGNGIHSPDSDPGEDADVLEGPSASAEDGDLVAVVGRADPF